MSAVHRAAAVLVLGIGLFGCGDDRSLAAERSEQARVAAVEAGLSPDVADLIALTAKGPTATYAASYRTEGSGAGSELRVSNRPPDRRLEIVEGGEVVTIHLTVDGESFECTPSASDIGAHTCRRTDAFPEAIGTFSAEALDELTESLSARLDDFTFAVSDDTVAGTDARCLTTTVRPERASAELAPTGRLCVSPEGVLLLVDQGGQQLTATAYTTTVTDDAFDLPGT